MTTPWSLVANRPSQQPAADRSFLGRKGGMGEGFDRQTSDREFIMLWTCRRLYKVAVCTAPFFC